MTDTTPALDEAFERMASAGFELPNGFVNHGAMACEALDALGFRGRHSWGPGARRFARIAGPVVTPRAGAPRLARSSGRLQTHCRSGSAISKRRSPTTGGPSVVEVWVPRLVPGWQLALFHGVIRVGHAVRAIQAADTSARREELARALGYWAARYRAGRRPCPAAPDGGRRAAWRSWPQRPTAPATTWPHRASISSHGVTGAMAIELLAAHLFRPDRRRRPGAQALWKPSTPRCTPAHRAGNPASPGQPARQ